MRWVRKLSGEIVTADEIARDKEKARTNHVEANYPGEAHSSKNLDELQRKRQNRRRRYEGSDIPICKHILKPG
jgi:hypothetical protein